MTKQLPTYIPIILHPLIRLAFVSPEMKAVLEAKGVTLATDAAGLAAIHFDDSEKDDFKSIPLIETLMMLSRAGVVFGEDYKQYYSPAAFMRELQMQGILREPFKSIAFSSKEAGGWMIKENVPNQIKFMQCGAQRSHRINCS